MVSGETLFERVQSALQDALSDAFRDTDDGFLVRWVIAAEIVDGTGQRSAWMMTPEGAMPWDTLGLLHFAVAQETAAITVEKINDVG